MFNLIVLDVIDENRVENIDYVNVVSNQLFENYSDACAECDKLIDRYIAEYVECDDEDANEEEYYNSLYVDNKRIYRNVLLNFEDARQFIVVKVDVK
jgi:hypothetical protein